MGYLKLIKIAYPAGIPQRHSGFKCSPSEPDGALTPVFSVFSLKNGIVRNSLEPLLEATPGIEPGYADLQSDASPLRHVALFTCAIMIGGA